MPSPDNFGNLAKFKAAFDDLLRAEGAMPRHEPPMRPTPKVSLALLADVDYLLREFDDFVGPCDHSVGICYCFEKRIIERFQETLLELSRSIAFREQRLLILTR